jgi:pimeloyl-ACP methyl ester carboxylesterase
MFDRGDGPPVIVIPGVQGRWEWMRPALDALARRCRPISYSLCGDFGSGFPVDRELGFEGYLRQLDTILERVGVERAVICGVSYGGLIAVRYAASRPHRVSALVLVSAPAPGWKPSPRQERYVARPWLSTPVFVATGPFRLWPEVRAALPDWRPRLRFAMSHALRILRAPSIPALMALRVRQQEGLDFQRDSERVAAPTLVITGEEQLDRVVPVHVTRRYADLIPRVQYVQMEGTGHIGLVTRPEHFARLVGEFAHAHHH